MVSPHTMMIVGWLAKGTERLALMIVAEKENRRRQIERLRKGYKRFNMILEQLTHKR